MRSVRVSLAFVGEFLDYINQGLVGFSVFRGEARNLIAEIVGLELRLRADFARKEAFAQRAEGNKADSKLFQGGQHLGFGLSPPERVFALNRGHRLHCMCTTNGFQAGLRQAEVLYFALTNQIFHRPGHLFDGHVWVDTVLVQEVNRLNLEPFQRGLDDLPDVLRPAVEAALLARVAVESELRRDCDFVTERAERCRVRHSPGEVPSQA